MKITALIPARGGSKGIKYKNIKKLNGKPLIQYSIELAQRCKYINNIVVSTDCNKIKNISKKLGASVPFLRPKKISQDLSTDYEFFEHYVNFLKENNYELPDLIVQLRPTSPTRTLEDLNKCIEIMLKNFDKYDSLRTVYEFEKSPFKMYTIENEELKPLFNKINNIKEPFNECRQKLPKTYVHNGYIDIVKTKVILKLKSISGDKIYPYLMDKSCHIDLDTEKDWEKLCSLIKKIN